MKREPGILVQADAEKMASVLAEHSDHHSREFPGTLIYSVHADVNANSSDTVYPLNWIPDYWMVVGRLTAGYIIIYPGNGASSLSFRQNQGTVRIPTLRVDSLTIRTVTATGYYSVYAVRELDGFEIES